MKMLEDLEEVVRYADDPSSRTDAAFVGALRFIRTHHATIRDMAARQEAAERDATVWRCTRSYPTGDGGRYYSEEFAKTKADMLIYKAKGYHCEVLNDETMQETGR